MNGLDATAAAFDGKEFVRTLTTSPGVYRMLDARGEPLYVGKAGNLKKRVGSYFLKPALQPRIAAMVAQISRIEVTLTRTEGEALLLEAQLIKSLKPRYNILLRDDKSYPYIFVSASSAAQQARRDDERPDPADFARLAFHRGAKTGKGEYFGPYPSAWAVRESLDLMQKLFRVRQCEDSYFRNRSRPCLQYQIGRCTAPCVGFIGVDEYRESVRHAAMFLHGKSDAVVGELGAAMERASAALEFEKAARLRDQIATLKRLHAQVHVQGASADLDALACRIESGTACVSVLFFRNGVNLGSRDFFPRLPTDADAGAVLAAFVAQYYLDKPVPRELLLEPRARRGGTARRSAVRTRAITRWKSRRRCAATARISWNWRARTRRRRWPRDWPASKRCTSVSNRCASCWNSAIRRNGWNASISRHTMGEATVASCVIYGPEGADEDRRIGASTSPASNRATITRPCARPWSAVTSACRRVRACCPISC